MRRELWIDLDGTLLASDSRKLKRKFLSLSLSYLRKEAGLSFFQALHLIHHMRKSIETPGSALLNEDRVAQMVSLRLKIPKENALTKVREMAVHTFSELKDCFSPMAGASEFVDWAHSRFDLILATNPVWPESVVKLRLSWAKIGPEKFLAITHVGSMKSCKPHVDYYRELSVQRNRNANDLRSSVLMIGDSLRKDAPVTKLGIPFYWLKPAQAIRQIDDLIWSGGFPELKVFLEKEWK